ncbi:MAG: 4-hydroxythreonine-4-phosphate dehydrogenase PdxA [Candidatus Omnitrophica bacterium]|nr:4-hydroxythreonine-4-phosphate dehydrogenase PdxA [Candidatus Omnitrophota bacterium]
MRTLRSGRARIAITMGDPSGVGPEVILKALASPKVKGLADFLVIGESIVAKRTARDAARYGRMAIEYIDTALELLRSGNADALVTGPVNKYSIRAAGIGDFQGHTEYLAGRTGTKKFAMMFVGDALKLTLATRHLPLRSVPKKLTSKIIYDAIALTHRALEGYFKVRSPKIAVCGLNPHAGEGGAFGDEDRRVIAPAIKKASSLCKNISGPLPADTAFYDALNKKYDAVIAMYHDQGLAPFKMLYFGNGVNLTLGLPFIRTSPDHGTAFDIAGKGIADPSSMIEAIRLACRLYRCSQKTN